MESPAFAATFNANEQSAAAIRDRLRRADVFAVNLVGGTGCGKTTLIEATLDRFPHLRSAVIVSNLQPRRDANRLARHFDRIVPVAAPSLGAAHVAAALQDLALDDLDLLFIESSSTTSLPVDLDLGQDVRVGVFSVSGGDDKAAQKPQVVRESDAIVLTKLDLLPYVPFELPAFREDVKRINPSAELIELSALRESHVERWIDWLESRRRWVRSNRRPEDSAEPLPEWFFG
jgi:hydrogenase nickel incorporation protein HypB